MTFGNNTFSMNAGSSLSGALDAMPSRSRHSFISARRRWPENPQAYDHFLRALPYFNSRHPGDYITARGHLDHHVL